MKTLDKTRLALRERDALAEAVMLLKRQFPVERVVLFGSRARDEGDAESDLDLLVLTSRELGWRERKQLVDALFDIELAHDVVLAPLIVELRQWNDGPLTVVPLHSEIDRDGILL